MVHRASIGLDVHAHSIAAAAFISKTGEVVWSFTLKRRRNSRLVVVFPYPLSA